MSTTDRDSSADLDLGPLGGSGAAPAGARATPDGEIWLNGDVLACACPHCRAPMSIRLWLMVADCWRCGTSIELTEEQERKALRLLKERDQAKRQERETAAAAIPPAATAPPAPAAVASPAASSPAAAAPAVPAPPVQAPESPRAPGATGTPARAGRLRAAGAAGFLVGGLLRNMPAWLISMVVHLVLLLLLGLWTMEPPTPGSDLILAAETEPERDELTLSTFVDPLKEEAGDAGDIKEDVLDEWLESGDVHLEAEVELVTPPNFEPPVPDADDFAPTVPATPPPTADQLAFRRNPQSRAEHVREGGGTSESEAAVARGLKWLARHQFPDGHWSLQFSRAPGANGRGSGEGSCRSDTAATAMAMLPFLGVGQTHLDGTYREVVLKGLQWLTREQVQEGPNLGDLRGPGHGRMYAHGQAAIVLCEAYALSGDQQLRAPAQAAVDFIVKAQHSAGGWRYDPGEPGDTSVVGWQIMALKSAQMAGIYVRDDVFERAMHFLDTVQTDKRGALYSYQPGGRARQTMTAEALLCRQYLGWQGYVPHAGLRAGADWLLENHPPNKEVPCIYYWYYATQVMHHIGGERWTKWNSKMRDILVDTQIKNGPDAGSWDPRASGEARFYAQNGGRLYFTALALCTLEVYYRHMPLNQARAVDKPR